MELPFGPGRRWVSDGGLLSQIVGGWQVNNILSFYSGLPFGIAASGTSLNAPENEQRGDQVVEDPQILGGIGATNAVLRSAGVQARHPGALRHVRLQ